MNFNNLKVTLLLEDDRSHGRQAIKILSEAGYLPLWMDSYVSFGKVLNLLSRESIDNHDRQRIVCSLVGHQRMLTRSRNPELYEFLEDGLSPAQLGGAILDIYCPQVTPEGIDKKVELQPWGIPAALLCAKANVPFVHCTSGYHHGAKYECPDQIMRLMGWPDLIDQPSADDGEADSKDWSTAIKSLEEQIVKRASDRRLIPARGESPKSES